MNFCRLSHRCAHTNRGNRQHLTTWAYSALVENRGDAVLIDSAERAGIHGGKRAAVAGV